MTGIAVCGYHRAQIRAGTSSPPIRKIRKELLLFSENQTKMALPSKKNKNKNAGKRWRGKRHPSFLPKKNEGPNSVSDGLKRDCSKMDGFESARTCMKITLDAPGIKMVSRSCTPNTGFLNFSSYGFGLPNFPRTGCATLTVSINSTHRKGQVTACVCKRDYCNGAIDQRATTFVVILGTMSLSLGILTFN